VSRRAAALAAAATAIVVLVAAAVVLSQRAPRLTGTDNVRVLGHPVVVEPGQEACQDGEHVPGGATRLGLVVDAPAGAGPALTVRVNGTGVRVPGGYSGGEIRVPLPPGAGGDGAVCVRNEGPGAVALGGQDTAAQLPPGLAFSLDGDPRPVVFQVRSFAGEASGWERAGDALRRWGYVTALGAATPYLAIALFAAAFAGAVALVVRGRGTALACAAVGFAAAAGWALTTPVFHAPDEPQHFAYLQRLAESGHVPVPERGPVFSDEEGLVFGAVGFNQVFGNAQAGRPPWSEESDREIDAQLARDPGRYTEGGFTNTTNNPPLYYAAELGPYWLATAAGGDFLDRLLAVRLGTALLIGLGVAFAFAFLRELLPRTPWAWTAGALALALQPLAGFVGGAVNNDAALFAAGAAVLWLVTRALRHGLDRRGAIGLGLAFGLGVVAKATIVGFAPGLVVAAAILAARAAPAERLAVVRRAALAAALALAPVATYLLLNATVWDRPLWSGAGTVAATGSGQASSLREFVVYLWQFYLPRLPFMADQQAGIPLYNVFFRGWIGRYGWLDTMFPAWAYTVASFVFAPILALAAAALWRAPAALARRRWEPLVLATLTAGLLVLIGWAGYRGRLDNGAVFEQARYLLPLGALYAALIALAARGAGRFGRAVGAALVVLACGHTLFSVMLVAGRFYA
jgi:hypothetical protein